MGMTQGEKMVWALAFERMQEKGNRTLAVMHAYDAVRDSRWCLEEYARREAAGDLDTEEREAIQMLHAMLGDDVREREAADLLVRVKNYFCAQQVCTPEAIREMKSELGSDIDTWLRDEKGK
jgi:hypothetical protein